MDIPYLKALEDYRDAEPLRLHTPGHKGKNADPILAKLFPDALALDIPAITGINDLPLEVAEQLAADVWGAEKTWFLVNGASQGNHLACLAVKQLGGKVLMQRNVHLSLIHGLILSDVEPVLIQPETDVELGLTRYLTTTILEENLQRHPEATAVFISSPSYYGICSDVRKLAEVAHAHGAALIVDEAWGAHFTFSPLLPESALAAGADLVISSTHKMLGSLTGSAMLHLGKNSLLPIEYIERVLPLIESTSPSPLLRLSLDTSRAYMQAHAAQLVESSLPEMKKLRAEINAQPGLHVFGEELVGCYGVAAIDPFHVAIDVAAMPFDGFALAKFMLEEGVSVEAAESSVVVLLFNINEEVGSAGERVLEVLRLASREPNSLPAKKQKRLPLPLSWGELVMHPRTAFFSLTEQVRLGESADRVSAETITVYPPGVPMVIPGEKITAAVLAYIETVMEKGGSVRGVSIKGEDVFVRVVS